MEKTYTIVREELNGEKIYIDYSKVNGFKVTPKKSLKYDGVKVNTLIIIKPSFIEKVIKKKVKRKLDYYLQYIISLMDSDDDDTTGLKEAYTDLKRYKSIIEYKYRKYLDRKYIELLLKKISILENELKMKIIYRQEEIFELDEKGKSR